MSVSVSDLFPHQSNSIDGYDRLYHTRRYFKSKALELPKFKTRMKGSRHDHIREYCGYGNMEKFLKKVADWNKLRNSVPVRYMDAIGIDYDILEMCLEIDQEAYMEKLKEPRFPKYANVRSGIHIVSYGLPYVGESEAISYVRDVLAKESNASFYIIYTDFLTIQIKPGERPVYYYQLPGLISKGDCYSFTEVRAGI